jgi:hypothetical protein
MKPAHVLQQTIVVFMTLLALAGCDDATHPRTPPVARPTDTASTVTATTAATLWAEPQPTHVEPETPEPETSTVMPTPTPTYPEATVTMKPTSVLPSATAPPQPSTTPTSASATPSRPASPQVLSFTVTPTTTHTVGEAITLTWEAIGDQVEICPIAGYGPVEIECQKVPLKGDMTFVTDEESMAYLGFGLRVKAGGSTTWSVADVHLQCEDLREWFFDNPPQRCPAEPALHSYAAGQYFEHGFMIWVEDTDDFYIFFEGEDEHGFQTFEWTIGLQLKPGASPDNRVGVQPPPGLHEPVSGFGLIWRGEVKGLRDDIGQRLGWATEPEFGFDTAYQCETPAHPRSWSCYLRSPRAELLHLHPDSTAQARFLWERD